MMVELFAIGTVLVLVSGLWLMGVAMKQSGMLLTAPDAVGFWTKSTRIAFATILLGVALIVGSVWGIA